MTQRGSTSEERRWVWWGQARDAACAIAGFTVLGVETYRGTYNPVAIGLVVTFLTVTSLGVAGRWVLTRNGNGNGKRESS